MNRESRSRGGGCRRLAESFGEPDGPPERSVSTVLLFERPWRTRVHVARERKAAKFWLQPIRLEYNRGFAATELNKVEALVRQNETELVQAWHDYFKSSD
jgi:hypothetical protein